MCSFEYGSITSESEEQQTWFDDRVSLCGQGQRQSEYRQSEVENIDTEVRLMSGRLVRHLWHGDLDRVNPTWHLSKLIVARLCYLGTFHNLSATCKSLSATAPRPSCDIVFERFLDPLSMFHAVPDHRMTYIIALAWATLLYFTFEYSMSPFVISSIVILKFAKRRFTPSSASSVVLYLQTSPSNLNKTW